MFIKIPIIHTRYKELTREDFYDELPFMRGYRGSFDIDPFERPESENNFDVLEIHPDKLAMLENIVEAAKKADVGLLFFVAPYHLSEEEQMNFNAVAEFAADNDVDFINFNHLYNEIDLDFSTDLRDVSHVNNYGAKKVTEYIADFLVSKYEIPDKRGLKGYELWEQNARYLQNKTVTHELEQAVDINDYFTKLKNYQEGKLVILALTGNHTALGDVYLESLLQMGITQEEYSEGGAWIIKDGVIVKHLSGQEYSLCFPIQNGEIHLESDITQYEGNYSGELTAIVNGVDYHKITNGVNIIVYDESLNQLIDAAGDDVYLGLEMTR